jgi:hypothetical protein
MSTQKTKQQKPKPLNQKVANFSEGILITGMHRSGTSMIAGLVEKMGVNQLGKKPMLAAADNRDGFYEDIELVEISDEIMRAFNATWDVPTVGSKSDMKMQNLTESIIRQARNDVFQLRQDVGEPWFIKDPRICLTLNEWRRILLLRIPVIFIVRNPHDVASSLMQRSAMNPRRALALWYRYNSALLRSVDRDQILVLDYDLTCSKPGIAQAAVKSFLETFLSRGDNSVFESETQVIFNPRSFSRSIDFSDAKLSKESKDCFDLYRKTSLFHLKTRLSTLKLLAEPSWVEEELNIAHREAFTHSQLEELNHKAEYLYTELETSRELITERDVELNQLRADTEQERSKLETQLEELNHKAEYLYTELETSRELITERNVELNQLRAELETSRELVKERNVRLHQIICNVQTLDQELTRMSITLAQQEFRTRDYQELVLCKEILSEAVLLLVEDVRRLTLRRTFRVIRSIKLSLHKTVFRNSDWYFRKNNILPMQIEGLKYLEEIIESEMRTSQYLELNPDIARSGINPFTHFILHGKLEGRVNQKLTE